MCFALRFIFGQLLQNEKRARNGEVLENVRSSISFFEEAPLVPEPVGVYLPLQGALPVDPPRPRDCYHEG